VIGLITQVFSTMTAEQVVAKLDAADIANARLNSPLEVWDHAQLKARKRWREVDTPGGRIAALLPPVTTAGFEVRMDRVPAVGEDTSRVLSDIGYSEGEIAALRANKVV